MSNATTTYDAQRKAEKRAGERDLKIPKVKDPKRRAACEADDCEWLRVYVPSVFRFPFTSDQKLMIEEIGQCLEFGLLKCFAAPRHDGKTSIARYLIHKYSLEKVERDGLMVPRVPLSLLISATSNKARDSLDAIKQKLRSRPGTPLYDDYPLECHVARYVGPAPARCNNVTADFRPLFVEWGADHIILPSFDDEGGMSGMIAALGITSNDIQGFNLYDVRPRFVLLDDLDDRDSLASKDGGSISLKIETNVDENVAGLGGPGETFGAAMLCTIPNRASVAFKYSDPRTKPSWSGIRLKKITKWPERTDLWEQYINLRTLGKSRFDESGRPLDKYAREAHRFYAENREAMDAGAEVSNPHDFVSHMRPDGSPAQLSTLQNCYDYIADFGMPSFLTEYQNDPPEDSGPVESGITPILIQKQLTGLPQRVIPESCEVLTHTVDVGKWKLHWVVRAWKMDGTGYTIDYGVQDVHGPKHGAKETEGLDRALRREVLRRIDEFKEAGYRTNDGKEVRETITLVDAGYRTHAIYAACAEAGIGVYPVMGFGKSAGCCGISFTPANKKTTDVLAYGEDWKMVKAAGRVRLVECSADKWKAWEHDRWMTATDKPGCLFLYGENSPDPEKLSADEIAHRAYAQQICAEVEVEEMIKGVLKRKWKAKGENHWLDASYYSCVAASIKGVRLPMTATAKTTNVPSSSVVGSRPAPKDRPSARELASRYR